MVRKIRNTLMAAAGLSLVLSAAFVGTLRAEDADILATIDGKNITQSDVDYAEQNLGVQFGEIPEDQRKAAVLSALIDLNLLVAEAEKEELDKTPDFERQAQFLRDQALHSAYLGKNVINAVTDEEVKSRYDAEISKLTMPEEVHARHILVETEEEARAIIADIEKGGSFEEIAKEKSKDGAASNGGDLGYFTKGRMVPEFEEAAFVIEPGTVGKDPVESQFGWHVIKVEDKRSQTPPTVEQVGEQIRAMIIREKYVQALEQLRGKAAIEISDAELKASVDKIHALQAQTGEEADADEGGDAAN